MVPSPLRFVPALNFLLLMAFACQPSPPFMDGEASIEEPMGRACPQAGSTAKPFSVTLPQQLVSVEGMISTNATKLRFIAQRSGVAYDLWMEMAGRFAGEVPPGAYQATLHGQDESDSIPLGSVVLQGRTAALEFAACASGGCELPISNAMSAPPRSSTAHVRGEITFVDGAETPLIDTPSSATVRLRFRPRGEPWAVPEVAIDFAANLRFDLPALPYGTYDVDLVAQGPALSGLWSFNEPFVVAEADLSWQGIVPTREATIEIDVNGATMLKNGRLGARGFVQLAAADQTWVGVAPIDPQGPARVSYRLIPGTFFAELRTYEPVGHGLLKGIDQDVLPTGNLALRSFDVGLQKAPLMERQNISVRNVRITAAKDVPAVVFKGPGDSFAWAATPQPGAPALVYGGCQAAVVGSEQGPTTVGFQAVFGEALGEFCIPCD